MTLDQNIRSAVAEKAASAPTPPTLSDVHQRGTARGRRRTVVALALTIAVLIPVGAALIPDDQSSLATSAQPDDSPGETEDETVVAEPAAPTEIDVPSEELLGRPWRVATATQYGTDEPENYVVVFLSTPDRPEQLGIVVASRCTFSPTVTWTNVASAVDERSYLRESSSPLSDASYSLLRRCPFDEHFRFTEAFTSADRVRLPEASSVGSQERVELVEVELGPSLRIVRSGPTGIRLERGDFWLEATPIEWDQLPISLSDVLAAEGFLQR